MLSVFRWVAHPALVKIAMDIFDEHMKGPHQVGRFSYDASFQ
jgi:hypothetical protein